MAKKNATTTTKATDAKATSKATPQAPVEATTTPATVAPAEEKPVDVTPEAPATTPAEVPAPEAPEKPAEAKAKEKPAKVNTLDIVAKALKGIDGVDFTHNTRNITVSNKATGKKLFEVWKRKDAIRVYAPATIADKAKGLAGATNPATGLNGYPAGTLSIYYPAGNIATNIPELVKAGLAVVATTKATATTPEAPAPATNTEAK